MKAKFNTDYILNGEVVYSNSFVELVKKYKDEIIEADEYPFGGYEIELDGETHALGGKELIIVNL